MTYIIKASTHRVAFLLTDATDNETGEPSKTPSVSISKNGATFAAASGTVYETSGGGDGWYYFDLTASETDTVGPLVVEASDTGTNTWRALYEVRENVVDEMLAAATASEDDLMNTIADHLLKRSFGSADASANGDGGTSPAYRSLMGVIAKQTNKTETSAGKLYVYEDDDSTAFFDQTITTNASAEPVVGLDTN